MSLQRRSGKGNDTVLNTDLAITGHVASFVVPRPTGAASAVIGAFTLCLFLSVFPNLDHALVVTVHAVDALTSLCKDEFVDAAMADFALEAVSVIRVVSGHDRLVEDG